jgi:hypothetical protein
MQLFGDAYVRRARIRPALLCLLPLVLVAVSAVPSDARVWTTILGVLGYCGVSTLMAQIGRDFGKRREKELFRKWGGPPTLRRLRHRDAKNSVTLARCHDALRKLIPGVKIPTAEEEAADPTAADEVYNSCVTFLINATRDHAKFDLLFKENVNYGFCRNLWGLKPIGLPLAAIGVAAGSVLPFVRHYSTDPTGFMCALATCAICLAFLLLWIFVFTPRWVRLPAEAYADRLLEACENLKP